MSIFTKKAKDDEGIGWKFFFFWGGEVGRGLLAGTIGA